MRETGRLPNDNNVPFLVSSSTRAFMDYSHIGIFWDIDGTIADSFHLGYSSTNEVLRNHGLPEVTEEQYHEGTKYCTPTRLAWHVTGNPDDPSGIKLGEEFDELYEKLVSTDTTPLYAGIFELVNNLNEKFPKLKFGALSNASTNYVKNVLTVNKLEATFSVALGANDVPAPKPSGDGLLLCCETIDVLPQHCIYIGDSPTDGLAAQAAGMSSVGVTWGSHPFDKIENKFVRIVHTIDDLKRVLDDFVITMVK